jgi:hypothetical protein
MTMAELPTYLVLVDPAFPSLVGGYIMACATFYERGFGVLSHQFLCCLLWSYGLELHHLTPLGILHMTAFMTLCKAFIGIVPHLNPTCQWLKNGWSVTRSSCVFESMVRRGRYLMLQFQPTRTSYIQFRLALEKQMTKKDSCVHSWLPLSFLISSCPCFCSVCLGKVSHPKILNFGM